MCLMENKYSNLQRRLGDILQIGIRMSEYIQYMFEEYQEGKETMEAYEGHMLTTNLSRYRQRMLTIFPDMQIKNEFALQQMDSLTTQLQVRGLYGVYVYYIYILYIYIYISNRSLMEIGRKVGTLETSIWGYSDQIQMLQVLRRLKQRVFMRLSKAITRHV